MAAVSSAPATAPAAVTSLSSCHENTNAMWDYPGDPSESTMSGNNGATLLDQAMTSSIGSLNRNTTSSSYGRMASADSFSPGQRTSLPAALAIESQVDATSSPDWAVHSAEERRRHIQQTLGLEYSEEDSKWIHRDKLAKIESEELQAAGFVIPRVRASSKQRRVRGQQSIDSVHSRHVNDAVTVDHRDEEPATPATPATPAWDLRTAEEIAEEEANAYFAAHSLRGGTRIPVARISPAPIPQDFLARGSPTARRIDSEGDTIAYTKTRSRSASASAKELEATNAGNRVSAAKRSVTDTSPKKMTQRKTSAASKSSMTTGRWKTRSGPGRDASRPPNRSPESLAASYQPEGDPPWVFDAYKPDPRLPPDQQLLPTVAKRLRQEQWEKEGKFGDAYDKDFRPLNDHSFPQAQQRQERVNHEDQDQAQAGDWPLKLGAAKSPKQSSYSTMPKISDRPPVGPTSPMTSSKSPLQPPAASSISQTHGAEPATEAEPKVETKRGCGCCIVM
ncbi:hypothetical protein E4U41_000278 [Claviceps citrina]|nr:hypothetical protein E4U41_000278 [Claviceps citrina]